MFQTCDSQAWDVQDEIGDIISTLTIDYSAPKMVKGLGRVYCKISCCYVMWGDITARHWFFHDNSEM